MSAERPPFELDPPAEGGLDVPVPLRRARSRRGARAAPPPQPQAPSSWPQRLATPFVSPAAYYLLGLLLIAGMLWGLFNPTFGVVAKAWPHELLGADGSRPFTWDEPTVLVAGIGILLVACLVALFFRAGPARGLVVASLATFPLVLHAGRLPVGDYVLPLATALAAGALIALPGRETARRSVLLVALTVIGASLFMPWPAQGLPEGQAGYYATALATVDHVLHPPADWGADTLATQLPAAVALLMLATGLLSLLGIALRATRCLGGVLMVALVLAWSLAWCLHGWSGADGTALAAWQAGLQACARESRAAAVVYALPFAGAVADLIRGRGATA
jgi:hypothetical protein